jgi:hypothetical protein
LLWKEWDNILIKFNNDSNRIKIKKDKKFTQLIFDLKINNNQQNIQQQQETIIEIQQQPTPTWNKVKEGVSETLEL